MGTAKKVSASKARSATADSSSRPGKPKAARTGPSPSTLGRQLRAAEQAMVKAQKRVDSLTERLTGLTDSSELQEVGQDLATAQSELDEHELLWLELAEQTH